MAGRLYVVEPAEAYAGQSLELSYTAYCFLLIFVCENQSFKAISYSYCCIYIHAKFFT